jgi:hypothetical protein
MLKILLRIAGRRGLTRQGALREAVARWIDEFGKPEDLT